MHTHTHTHTHTHCIVRSHPNKSTPFCCFCHVAMETHIRQCLHSYVRVAQQMLCISWHATEVCSKNIEQEPTRGIPTFYSCPATIETGLYNIVSIATYGMQNRTSARTAVEVNPCSKRSLECVTDTSSNEILRALLTAHVGSGCAYHTHTRHHTSKWWQPQQ